MRADHADLSSTLWTVRCRLAADCGLWLLRFRRSELLPLRPEGLVAEWLRRGLQILAPRFDSGRGLQKFSIFPETDRAMARLCRHGRRSRARLRRKDG
ncbi:hypothetical protein BOSEA31B_14827 [Hyphomicrobiales bacterium]|nr:hypothetical protein BOSEA31B_14827 [Hyphomicrobiales bacterium]CAH1701317.1 hypothetical protein BOSEA1005_21016 [Hyphomicrobiales bacterium]